ncbi:hypothetical protein [Pontiella sulfatireligans]|uniref:Chromosome partition protein Smc n=1 Tax=Pontiella sulfatireligans TaxID=2750658 RepID=A0A6C2UNR0_9BACT|nr:hypothetical protein [Pontiella sulfatireligans]VGO21699.1 hypothetical protein SCARR_03773 [Pontiella sulfatireligans]
MQIKTIAMMVVAGCSIGMLTGCGIPEEEHNAMIAQMASERQTSEDELNGKIADLESVVKSQKASIRTKTLELDDAAEQITALKKTSAAANKALATEKTKVSGLERDLATSKSSTLAARDQAQEAESQLATLEVEHEALKVRFEQFERNMRALGGSSAPSPVADIMAEEVVVETPKTDAEAALDILNQMGNQ